MPDPSPLRTQSSEPPFGMILYVCPDCGDYADDLVNGYPQHSSCEHRGHREATVVEVMPVTAHEAELKSIADLLPRVYDGTHIADCPYVDVLSRILEQLR